MRYTLFSSCIAAAALAMAGGVSTAHAETVTLKVVNDRILETTAPDAYKTCATYGDIGSWNAYGGHAYRYIAQVDLTPLTASSTDITTAALNIDRVSTSWDDNDAYALYQVIGAWQPSNVTFAAQPTLGSTPIYPTVLPYGIFSFDITAMVKGWIDNPASQYGILIKKLNEDTALSSNKGLFACSTYPTSGSEKIPVVAITLKNDDVTAPVIANIGGSNLASTSYTVQWTTSEPATGEIRFGTNQNSLTSRWYASQPLTSFTASLTGLTAGTQYYFVIAMKDAAGNEALSPVQNFNTPGGTANKPDLAIESISDRMPNTVLGGVDLAVYFNQYWPTGTTFKNFEIELKNLTTGSSISTAVGSSAQRNVDFHITWPAGTYQLEAKLDSSPSQHVDESNEQNNSLQKTITIPTTDVLKYGDGTYTLGVNDRVQLNNNVVVRVADIITDAIGYKAIFTISNPQGALVKTTQALTASTQPYLYDDAGAIIALSLVGMAEGVRTLTATFTHTGTVPLMISGLTLADLTPNMARFTWATNKSASGFVYYRENGSSSYAWQGTDEMKTSHSIIVSNLASDVTYSYYISAKDATGAIARTVEATFTTPLAEALQYISGAVSALGFTQQANGVRVNWDTDKQYCELVYQPHAAKVTNVIEAGKTFIVVGNKKRTDQPALPPGPAYLYETVITNLTPGRPYYFRAFCRTGSSSSEVFASDVSTFTPISTTPPPPPGGGTVPTPDEQALRDRIQRLELRISELERQVVEAEKQLTTRINAALAERLHGKILLQVEGKGEAWYVDPITSQRFYLKDGQTAYQALQAFGLGIANRDLEKIPVGLEERAAKQDSDHDGLDDRLEEALGTDPQNPDTDGDGHTDGEEVKSLYSPRGTGRMSIDRALGDKLEGRIVLQVEDRGQAWYIHEGRRYYLKDGDLAYQIMRYLSLGITNSDLRQIGVGAWE